MRTRSAHNLSTSVISNFSDSSGTHSGTDLINSNMAASPGGDNHVENLTQDLDNTFTFQKYVSEVFVGKNVADHYDVWKR